MNFQKLLQQAETVLGHKYVFGLLSAAIILVVGTIFAKRASHALSRISHLDPQQQILVQKFSYYGMITIIVAAALSQMGFDLKVLLGAA
ncbi:MAG: hypothetical protein NDI61_10635, partial [Bdellovibrionaceae bacterium]|nr:hypothetical protein [Pseudobdellovibrionaceae bacterium]